jgi:GWxTD domain-containing protein
MHNELSVDWAAFNYENGISLVEVYYSCPYHIFQYVFQNDTIFSTYQTLFYLKSIDGPDSLQEISRHRAIIPSFEIAQRRDMKLVDGFGFYSRPGRYWFNLSITDGNSKLSVSDTINVPDFSKAPVLSNLELASSVVADSSGGKFTKGVMKILPNPELNFGKAYELIYIYVEGYNLSNDTFPYELSYQILSQEKSIIKSFPKDVKVKTSPNFANTFAISTKGLMPGRYFLELSLKDHSSGTSDKTEKTFWIVPKDSEEKSTTNMQFSSDTSTYSQEIRFLATPSELNQYNNLGDVGKNEFLRKFWQRHNLDEFVSRVKFVDEKYGQGRVLGRDTDRGRIYIKYGPPDEVVAHTMIEHTKPHEHWYYYSRGFHFIFIDIRGNNNFQLIYSNCDNEPKNPNWENYVDPLELEDLQ